MWIELVGHTTYLLLALSYLVRDIVWLRVISIPASLCSIAFCYWRTDQPVWLIIYWNIAFLAVNVYQLGVIHIRAVRLGKTPTLARFANMVSPEIRPHDAIELFQRGTLRVCDAEEEVLTEGQESHHLYFIWQGRAEVWLHGQRVGACNTGTFLGDIGYLTQQASSATVRVEPGTTLLQWERTRLTKLLKKWPTLNDSLQRHLVAKLSAKLQDRESELTELKQAESTPASQVHATTVPLSD